jgi:hypothetical protein
MAVRHCDRITQCETFQNIVLVRTYARLEVVAEWKLHYVLKHFTTTSRILFKEN